jgi:hypothetical protein
MQHDPVLSNFSRIHGTEENYARAMIFSVTLQRQHESVAVDDAGRRR